MFVPEKLSSGVFNVDNPPKDFADVAFLVPHEALRRELSAMSNSVSALNEDYPDNENWKVLYFCEWYLDYFLPNVINHHDNEEKIYIPELKKKGVTVPDKVKSDHEELKKKMMEIKTICDAVVKKNGSGCKKEITDLKNVTPAFATNFTEHLDEEETVFPPLVREKMTEEEHQKVVDTVVKSEGLGGTRLFLPVILEAMKEWATKEFVDEFVEGIPGPIKSLLFNYYIPDYKHHAVPLRDAPLASAKPSLSKVPCCKIPCCFPCIF